MARLAKVYQCMGMKLLMVMLMNIGLGMEFIEQKSFGPKLAYDMVSIPTNFLGTADTPSIPTTFVGTAIPTMFMGTLHFD